MSHRKYLRSFLTGLGVAAAVAGCNSDKVAGPDASAVVATREGNITASASHSPPPSKAITSTASSVQDAVVRKHPLQRDVSASKVIGPNGGELTLPGTGMKVRFAKGALTENTTITATAYAGAAVAYDFGPHGTTFNAPVTIEQKMSVTTIDKDVLKAGLLSGAYLPHGFSDIVGATANVTEIRPAVTNVGRNHDGNSVLKNSAFVVEHFSGYLLICGRH